MSQTEKNYGNALPRYLEQDSPQTVAEALGEYYARMENLLDPDAMAPEIAALFRRHDVAHVVFGCDTSLHDEGLIDTWTLLGSDVGFRAYLRYLRDPVTAKLFTDIGLVRGTIMFFTIIPDLLRVIVRARRMSARWPWTEHERYLQRPLAEIRRELGIRVLPHRS